MTTKYYIYRYLRNSVHILITSMSILSQTINSKIEKF